MDSDELIELVRDLYRTSVDNRRFLHTRVLGADVETATYRQLIVEAIYPDPLSQRPVRVAEAERLLRHYRQASDDIEGAVDLMLTFVESGTEQAADLGYGEERYFAALERALDAVAAVLPDVSPDSRARAVDRIRLIADRADPIGWGYCDYVREIAARSGRGVRTRRPGRG